MLLFRPLTVTPVARIGAHDCGDRLNTLPTTLTQTQAATMLSLQDRLNVRIDPAWIGAGQRFLRAAFVESAEALEHHGWKWWKKQTIDLPQVQMELIDILHFYLSHTLVQAGGSPEQAAALVTQDLQSSGHITLDGQSFELATLDVPTLLELIGGLAVCQRASYLTLQATMTACALSWDEAFKQYISKNMLNIFRQDNGYKAGTYIKMWNGEEDNVVLARLMATLDAQAPDFADRLYAGLVTEYAAATVPQS